MIDTSVLVAGISGFKIRPGPRESERRTSARLACFTWLITEDILAEYKEVLRRLGVRRNPIGDIINLLREEAELVDLRATAELSPDPDDNVFCACAEQGRAAFIATLNRKDFPQKKLSAKVISPSDPIPRTRRAPRATD